MLNCLTNKLYGGAKRIARRGLFSGPEPQEGSRFRANRSHLLP